MYETKFHFSKDGLSETFGAGLHIGHSQTPIFVEVLHVGSFDDDLNIFSLFLTSFDQLILDDDLDIFQACHFNMTKK